MKLFYLHWNEQELNERIKPLKQLKYSIQAHWNMEAAIQFGDTLPDIFIISLDRLPSHGREYANWLWESKKRQHIPIIFVDGKPDKIELTKTKFPKAIFCSSGGLPDKIRSLASE